MANRRVGGLELARQPAVGKAFLLERAQRGRVDLVERCGFQLQLDLDNLLDLHQKPAIDLGQRKHFFDGKAHGKRIAHIPDAVGPGRAEFLFQHFAVLGLLVHPVHADFQPAQGFLERFLEGAAHRHDLADRLHLRRQAGIGGREFFECETRNLGHHIVDARLETGWGGASSDLVAQLVERVAHGELGSDLGNRETRGLGSQRRRARHARIHLDHDHAAIVRIDGELHVRTAGVNADFAQHRQTRIAQNLVFLVGKRLRGRHGDRVAGVHTHRVEVFNRADDDAVVRRVAHHLHLVLFPAEQRFFNQKLAGRRRFQAALADFLELFGVVGNAAAGAAQRETGADHGRETQRLLHDPGLFHAVRDARTRRTQTNFRHRVLELEPVLGFVNGFGLGADQLDAVFFQYAMAPQIERAIECRLAAHRGKDRIGPFLGDDFFHRLPGDRLDIGHVGRRRVGHDRRRIAVDQNDLVALLAQGLAGLNTGIVEFAGLADDDRPGANNED